MQIEIIKHHIRIVDSEGRYLYSSSIDEKEFFSLVRTLVDGSKKRKNRPNLVLTEGRWNECRSCSIKLDEKKIKKLIKSVNSEMSRHIQRVIRNNTEDTLYMRIARRICFG